MKRKRWMGGRFIAGALSAVLVATGLGAGATAAFADRSGEPLDPKSVSDQVPSMNDYGPSKESVQELVKLSKDFAKLNLDEVPASLRAATGSFGIAEASSENGPGLEWHENTGISQYSTHVLSYFIVNTTRQWCIDFEASSPTSPGSAYTNGLEPKSFPNVDSAYKVDNNAQMGWLIDKYGLNDGSMPGTDENMIQAALSLIVHFNYEEGRGVEMLPQLITDLEYSNGDEGVKFGEAIKNAASNMTTEARRNAGQGAKGSFRITPEENRQYFSVDQVGIIQDPGNSWIGGADVTLKITSGNAVFDPKSIPNGTLSNNNTVWKGKTSTSALSIGGRTTANGKITVESEFGKVSGPGIEGVRRLNDEQDTIRFKESLVDPVTPPPTVSPEMVFDFQPMLLSSTEGAQAHVVEPGATTIKDKLTVFADPDYEQPEWLGTGPTFPTQDTYKPLPVKFKGEAYYVGEEPIAESATIPANATKVAEASFIADKGPGDYTVEAKYSGDPGFVVWVWKVDKTDQPKIDDDELYMLADNWSDHFAVAEEHTSVQWPGKIESNLKVHTTNDNTYLVDDIWISDLPKNHPDFAGGFGYNADEKVITQKLYFWEGVKKEDVTSLNNAELIASVDVPAKNGFYPSVGSLDFKLKKDADGRFISGTYQVVHTFKGDDRVSAFVSQIPDFDEMYEIADPAIETTATGEGNSSHVGPFEKVTIVDTVCYTNLIPGKEYELKGVLMNQETGKPLLSNGKEVRASKKFTPTAAEGCEDLPFTFDASALEGETTVVFEDLYQNGVLVATHSDIEDEGQTIYIPEIGTTANGEVESMVGAHEEATIVDEVCYSNLIPGKEYEIKGVLMNQGTGEPLLSNGEEVHASKTFVAEKASGCEELTFVFDASALAGETTVVFEDLFIDGVKVGTHSDIEDEGQTIYIPEIGTTAMGEVEDLVGAWEDITIVDQACYTNLIPGKEYTVEGVLMDQSTGKELLVDGKPVTGSTTFTPEEAKGCVEIEFTFNASALAGTTTVVFEDLFVDGVKIATHADIEDEDQTVYIPDVKTTATGPEGEKEITAGPTTITDKVCYTNLSPGKEYTIKGVLMDKSTGKPLLENGKKVTSETTFTAKETDGCVELEFKLDASTLAGKEVVVFEDLYREDVLIGTHADLTDKDQTVKIVEKPVVNKPVEKTGNANFALIGLAGLTLLGAGAAGLRGGLAKRKK